MEALNKNPSGKQTAIRDRILLQAKTHLFTFGYSAFTMDKLAGELGMSKKTLYVHFPNKDAIIISTIDKFAAGVRTDVDEILLQLHVSFIEKLRGFALMMIERLGHIRPEVLRDIQRSAPHIYQHIDEARSASISYTFGRFIEEGQIGGSVRDHMNPTFAGQFYVHAMQGMMNPTTLERLKLTPAQTFDQAIRIFYTGLLTPKGQKEYEKNFPH